MDLSPDQIEQFRGLDTAGRKQFFERLDSNIAASGATPEQQLQMKQQFATALAEDARVREITAPGAVQTELGSDLEPSAAPGHIRFDLGRSATDKDREAKLQSYYGPNSTIRSFKDLQGNQRTFVKPEGQERFIDANPPGFDPGDVTEFAGANLNLQTAAEIGATALPGGLLARGARTGLAAATGNVADAAVEGFRGFESRNAADIATAALTEGAVAGGADFVASAGNSVVSQLLGRGGTSPDALEASAERRNVVGLVEQDPDLMLPGVGQGQPGIFANIRTRAAAFGDRPQLEEARQGRGLQASTERIINSLDTPEGEGLIRDLSPGEIGKVSRGLQMEADREARKALNTPWRARDLETRGADAIEKGIYDPKVENSFRAVTNEDIRRKYQAVSEIAAGQKFTIDLSETQDFLREELKGFAAQGQAGPVRSAAQISDKLRSIVNDIMNVNGGAIVNGAQITVDGEQVGEAVDALGFARSIQKRLGDFFGSNLDISQTDEALARRIRERVSEAIEGIEGGNPDFQYALKQANAAVTKQHEVLDRKSFLKLRNVSEPQQVLDSIENGNLGYQSARLLVNSLPPDRLDDLRGALKEDLLRRPKFVDTALENLNRDGVGDLLLTRPEMDALRSYAANVKAINGRSLQKLMQSQSEIANRGREIFLEADPADLDLIWAQAGKQERKDIQAGFLEYILDGAAKRSSVGDTLDAGAYAKNIQAVLGDPVMLKKMRRILPESAIDALRNNERVASFYSQRGASQAGASISAGEAAGQVANPIDPGGIATGIIKSVSAKTLGRWLTDPKFVRWFNSSKEPLDPQSIRTIAVVSATAFTQSREQQASEERE
jgi:hypothetical protein